MTQEQSKDKDSVQMGTEPQAGGKDIGKSSEEINKNFRDGEVL